MKRVVIFVFLLLSLSAVTVAQSPESRMTGVRSAIEKHLGRPYVWGASGMKSFDCSGFLWRVMYENGMLVKRTTARKFYMMLPSVPEGEQWTFGTIVFFDKLKHVGIIDTPSNFYHAQVSRGTNRSEMNSFWRRKIYGFKRLPLPAKPQAQ